MKEKTKRKLFSEEYKKKLSETKKEMFKHGLLPKFIGGKGEDNFMFGKHHSKEYKKKLSEKLSGKNNPFYGKKHSEKNIKRIKAGVKKAREKGKVFGYQKGHVITEEQKKQISKANSGRKNPFLTELNKNQWGEDNHAWNGGTSFEPYDKSFNDKFKRAVRKRDNQICMLCGIHREKLNKALSVHHINYNKLLSVPQNCCSVCHKCNIKVNTNRSHWTKFFQSLLLEKYGYEYSKEKEVILNIYSNGKKEKTKHE